VKSSTSPGLGGNPGEGSSITRREGPWEGPEVKKRNFSKCDGFGHWSSNDEGNLSRERMKGVKVAERGGKAPPGPRSAACMILGEGFLLELPRDGERITLPPE